VVGMADFKQSAVLVVVIQHFCIFARGRISPVVLSLPTYKRRGKTERNHSFVSQ